MSWMKRRGQPSPNTTTPGVPMYNPNQHSNVQQPYQQWPQQPISQQYNNDWYNQSKTTSKTPPTQQSYAQSNTNNYWQQPSYNQPQPNYNTNLPNQQPMNQYQQYNQYPPQNQHQQYYTTTNTGYAQQHDNFSHQNYAQQNYYPGGHQQQDAAAVPQPPPIQSRNSPGVLNQVPQQQQPPTEEDPWNWGWDDNTNSNTQPQPKESVNQNNIADSFTDDTWNWSVEANQSNQPTNQTTSNTNESSVQQPFHNAVPTSQQQTLVENQQNRLMHKGATEKLENENLVQNIELNSNLYPPPQQTDTVEELPSMPALRRVKNENLTPQWSIESQVSQDSSEDVLLTSESDNRSNVLSQSSTTSQSPSRPASTHDANNDYPPQAYQYDNENITAHQQLVKVERNSVPAEPANSEYYQENSQSVVENVSRAMQDMSLNAQFENKEIVSPEVVPKEDMQQPLKEPTPPPPPNKMSPPLMPPPPIQSASTADLNKNPYKKKPGLTLKNINKMLGAKEPAIATTSSQNVEPAPVFLQNTATAFSQSMPPRPTDNLGVNLETLPDNSERPDQLPVENVQKTVRKTSTVQQNWPENCEIAPINDRNQYLETGQLSDADVPVYSQSGNDYQSENAQGTSGDNSDSLPPPGLRRLVLGQMEQNDNDNQPIDNSLDEPPPGLSRMVLGSTAHEIKKASKAIPAAISTRRMADVFQPSDYQNNEEPPVGLHRMVPGESSSPESSFYVPDSAVFQSVNFDDRDNYVSESELNQMGVNLVSQPQRSATIGADTPPVTNQQNISNTGYSSSSSVDPLSSREGAVGIDNDLKEPDLNSGTTNDENKASSLPPDNNRREDIDGEPQDEISPVRDQTVGQNTTDNITNSSQQDKHRTRNYTTDSEHEQPKERHNRSSSPGGRYDKDRRYYDDRRDRDRQRDRDSPDRYRGDRKYDKRRPKDRRYEDDTDYYSDKERTERRQRDEREEYERRYNSLRKDKDRDRRRDRREYDRDDRRNDYYYNNRYDDDYYAMSNRSRPSSRSDSMHDSYRERNRPLDREHDRTRHRDRDHERDRPRRTRDPYNSYYSGYNYDPYSPYYQQYQYQYYENLRRTNPQAYAEWYRKYYQSQGGAAPHVPGYSTEDRASVHSGRSSANEEMNKDRYTRQSYYSQQSLPHYYREIQNASTVYTVDDSRFMDQTDSSLNLEDTTTVSQRLTPAKFSTAHIKASISSGNLLNILPHYPLDGQPAILEIINLQSLLADNEEQRELSEFPGPLIKGVTHKKTIIEYCEMKIRKAHHNSSINDIESYILMWELLILLLRQNGMVVGTDIAELLMKNKPNGNSRRASVSSSSSTQHTDTIGDHIDNNRVSPQIHYKEEYITDKFREYLLYGSEKEALEWAMKNGLWGHALFLASKLDKRTYASVMMRFANGLPMNDPLQTLYQLLSGRQPASVTCVADEKWGDWRPHLAMILSNTTQHPDLDRKAITTLGDTLLSRGNLYAAHFCYLMAQIEFGRYGQPNVKLVLLSSNQQKPFSVFATNEGIFMTEIYEYACSLSDAAFAIPEFQHYKYLMGTRMVDHGLLEKGLSYLERVAIYIKQDPSRMQQSLISRVCELADRLKYCDPTQDETQTENSWLSDLKVVLNDYNMGLITHESTSNLASLEPDMMQQDTKQMTVDQQQQQWQQQQDYYQQQQQQTEQRAWQTEQQPIHDYSQQAQQINYQENELQQSNYDSTNYQDQQQYWNQQQQQQQQQQPPMWDENTDSNQQRHKDDQIQSEYWNTAAQSEPTEIIKEPKADEQQYDAPQISMPNQSKAKSYFDDDDNKTAKQASPAKPKPAAPILQDKPASTGWFGGIWSKLALRPKNQMKLPDDKNPTIVWNEEKKRWVNLEEDNSDVSTEVKPPPKMSDMFMNRTTTASHPSGPPSLPPSGPTNLPPSGPTSLPTKLQNYPAPVNSNPPTIPTMQPSDHNSTNNGLVSNASVPAPVDNSNNPDNDAPRPPSQPNMFKLQRGRNIKKAYVDVFNPGGVKTAPKSSMPASEIFGAVPSGGAQMNYFVPQPISDPNAPTDFLTPQQQQTEDHAQLSRWSSASSLSREVQFYMQRPQRKQSGAAAPMMYNPNQFANR